MTTSLSIDSIPASLLDTSSAHHLSAIQNSDTQSSFQQKKGASFQTPDLSSNCSSQHHQSSHIRNGSPKNSHSGAGAHTKKRGDSQTNSQQQQAQLNLANSLYYTYPYLPYISPSTSHYSAGSGAGQQALPSSQSNSGGASGNNRRSGKKKTQASSSQMAEQRLYWGLKKRDQPVSQGKGSSQGGSHHAQVYKPKNPPSITEWFCKLSSDERVNALTTISPHATDTFINMHQKQEATGKKFTFADMNNQHEKQSQSQQQQYPCSYSQYSQYVAQIFQASQYDSLTSTQEQGYLRSEGRDTYQRSSSLANSSFDENYYCKERTEIEMNTITRDDKDRDKIYSEEELLKHVRILDFNKYMDTLSISQEVVQDPDHFLKLVANATSGKAFQQPCLFKFDPNTQENTIDDPSWFKKRGFYSLAECVIALFEQALWAHYNYENNQNLGNSKVNDLPALFKDRGESDFSEVSADLLAKFWNQSSPDSKNVLLEMLKENARGLIKTVSNGNRGKGKYGKGSGSLRSSDFQASYSINDWSHRGGDSDAHDAAYANMTMSEEQQLIYELKDIVELAGKDDMFENLSQSPLNRAGKRFDKLCREFLRLLRQKYQEDLVEMLLQEEQKQKSSNKWAHNNKRKKKKNLQQETALSNSTATSTTTTHTSATTMTTPNEELVKTKKKKQKKQMFSPQTNQADQKHLVSSSSKKRKGGVEQQSEHNKSFDDSLKQTVECNKKEKEGSALGGEGDEDDQSTSLQDDKGSGTNSYEMLKTTQKLDQIQQAQKIQLSTSKSVGGGDADPLKGIQETKNKSYLQDQLSSKKMKESNTKSLNISSGNFTHSDDEGMMLDSSPQRQFSEQEEMQIIDYVKELARDMVDRVCVMHEIEARAVAEDIKSKGSTDYRNLAATVDDKQEQISQRKCSFKKKGQPQQDGVAIDENSNRKASFNKKYSEDYQQRRNTNNKKTSQVQQVESTETESHRKGVTQKTNNQEPSIKKSSHQNAKDVSSDQISQDQSSNQDQNNGGNKKKRNRKKGKMNDQDIMNNFVKNLQSNSEDTCTTENEGKSDKHCLGNTTNPKQHQSAQQKKQGGANKATPANNKSQEETKGSEKTVTHYKQKPNSNTNQKHQSQVINATGVKIEGPRGSNYNGNHKNSGQDKDLENQSSKRESFDSLSNQDTKSDKPCVSMTQPSLQANHIKDSITQLNNNTKQTQKLPKKSLNQPQSFKNLNFKNPTDCWDTASLSGKTDSSLNDNSTAQITTTSDIKSNQIYVEKQLLPPHEELMFYQQNSQEYPVTTTTTPAMIEPSLIQPFKNEQIGTQIRENLYSPQILPSQMTMYQTYPQFQVGLEEKQIPPLIQSPYSCLSTQAQCFTPKDYNQLSSNMNTQSASANPSNKLLFQNQYSASTSNQFQLDSRVTAGGYQSFQGTPVKGQKVGYRNSAIQINSSDNYSYQAPSQNKLPQMQQQYSQQDPHNANYMTPPQTAKKSANYYSQGGVGFGQGGGEFRKSQKTDLPLKHNQRSPQQQHYHHHQYRHRQSSQEDQLLLQQHKSMPVVQQQQPFLNHAASTSTTHHHDQIFDYYENEQMRLLPSAIHYPPAQQDNLYIYNQHSSPNQPRYVDPNQNLLYQFINQLTGQQSMVNGGSSLGPTFMPPAVISQDFHHQHHPGADTFNESQCSQQVGIQVDSNEYVEAESQFYKKLDSDIHDFVAQIKRNLDLLQPERQQVLNQIKHIAQEVYVNQVPRVIVFGSLITGLALESSDMDLAVTDLKIDDRYAMISEMAKLAAVIESWECLESFKFIDTASIPVIKLKVNLNKLRDMNMSQVSDPDSMKRDFEARPIRQDQQLLSVDITFDDSSSSNQLGAGTNSSELLGGQFSQAPSPSFQANKTHLGLESCYLVQHYIANYPNLKEVAILLKKYLAVHELNLPYNGGISSYSTVLLIVAYMNYFKRQTLEALSPSQLLMGFLDFYGNFFNPSTWGINVINEGSYFQQMGSLTLHNSNFMILDPLNLQNNTTRNSYLTSSILRQFQCAFNNLKSLILKNLNLAKHNSVLNSTSSGSHQLQPDSGHNTDQNHSQNTSSPIPITKEAHLQSQVIASPNKEVKDQDFNAQTTGSHEGSNSITLCDAITNIEVIKRGNFERFLTNLGQNKALDLGGISDLTVLNSEPRNYEAMSFQNHHVSPLTQQQLIYFANINLLETFFAKDSFASNQEGATVKGNVNLSLQELKTTNVSEGVNKAEGSKTVKE